jgi:hypothetical protein
MIIALAIALSGGRALAENWVMVYDEDPIWIEVDKDSIRRGSDNLVYFTSDGPDRADRAVDCQKGLLYTLKLYVMNGLEYPNWREDGQPIVPDSAGEAELRYVCANA